MNNIEIGEYVRTCEGHIGKIIDLDIDMGICVDNRKESLTIDEIVKHSKNIIDLIELYDYVNGFLVFDIIEQKNGNKLIHIVGGTLLETKDIKSVVTKEKFEEIEYEVKG